MEINYCNFKKKDFIYLFIHETHGEREAETQAEGEAGSMREPEVGFNPGSPGSHPGLKAVLSHLGHPMPVGLKSPQASASIL